ncbi:MAG: ribbon-helix-helix protein, CopG family [Deltaproteobacteria bacterium]|nr:ribbon-helix-helix protein, CopG family [Deltaproteobacteria bacterium]
MRKSSNVSDLPKMSDEELENFWDMNQPEDFGGWKEDALDFRRLPKKLIQVRLDPKDVRIIDRESKRTGIDRSQLVRAWVKEKIEKLIEA